jgi:hypothetical protein
MAADDDDFDSPFAHVPEAGAGPTPMQTGPFTYERMLASTGRASLGSASPTWRVTGWLVIAVALAIVFAGLLVGFLLS